MIIIIILFIIILLAGFLHQHLVVVFHWSLNDSKSPQVFRTLLSILASLNNTVIWIVAIHPQIFNSSSFPLGTVPSAPIIIGININLMFHSYLSSLARSKNLSLFLFSLIFILWSVGLAKSTIRQVLIFS